ncbi:TetR/AcrR family transcriptional regulator [Ruminococcus sp. OA3]|uniref:TetR/AcrR family transcriptional regulator n=1 Tax=Ruminococcus sp. OA3 TaxID=2914164 RepID=UPI001F0593AF|nr:TetR/AcrR family transcriptional regulator [Ruminococcus sp. OA3]MCH1982211.1 TetR/AcrR family transcriptional regulator [Ruminococcus sp. OA3]
MKKEIKSELTRERIIKAAIQEFGQKGYEATVLNTICKDHEISKGLFYHNFKGKEELYLSCVEKCFLDVVRYFQEQEIHDSLQKYMELRLKYFSSRPLYARIFFEAVLQPPAGLGGRIKELKTEFDLLNRQIYRAALSQLRLREGITETTALEYYELMQEMFNGYFSSPAYSGKDFGFVITEHEKRLSAVLDFMLYGIAERGE